MYLSQDRCKSKLTFENLLSASREQPARLRTGRTSESNRNHRRSAGDEDAAQSAGQVIHAALHRQRVVLRVEIGLDAEGLQIGRMVQEEEAIVISTWTLSNR